VAAEVDAGDLPPEEFRRLAHEVVEWMADYLADVESYPVFPTTRPGEVASALPRTAPEHGESLDDALADFRDIIVPGITHWNHPAFFAWFSITGSGPGILGEMLAAALNVNAMVWRSSPAATELEDVTSGWLRDLLGLPGAFEGVINDTASSSSLYALAAAREVAYRASHEEGLFGQPPGRVYASDQAHSSVEKAVLTLGLGKSGYRTVESDEAFRMRPDALRDAIAADVAVGVRPVAVVATLGTTSSAALDPVAEIGDVAHEHGAWLHVDAAYGGPAAIVPELRPLFTGWERADSVVVNPHKWLFTPVDCSVLFCRRPEELVRAFSIVPDYLTSADQGASRDLMDYGVALGRRFRALKLWLVLRYFGRRGIVERIRAHVRMARELADRIAATPEWTLAAPTLLSTVAFRFAPAWEDGAALDRANHAILERVNASGEVFLSHTVLDGRVTLRLAIGNLKTTAEHVSMAWELLKDAGREQSMAASRAGVS
jgi:aromatic-L-amino-acid decarboxylase